MKRRRLVWSAVAGLWTLLLTTGAIGQGVPVDAYPWASLVEADVPQIPLRQRFDPPRGFSRIELSSESFGAFLRDLPIRTDRTYVLSHRGVRLGSPSAAVVLLDVGSRDLQQCADAAIRLHAEYLWQRGRAAEAAYHFTSGDRSRWVDWQRGERYRVKGARVERESGPARPNTHAEYRRWLDLVFTYAGSLSLARDTIAVSIDEVAPGDLYVMGGSPGHVVVILDVAIDAHGRRAALIGQSFMPAQEFHVLRGRGQRVLDEVWFLLPEPEHRELDTPSWRPFGSEHARRFR
jgi:hypothetical protein